MTKVVADTLPPRLVGYTAPQAVEDLVKGPVEEIYRARDRHLSGTPLMVQLPGFGPRRLRYRREELGSPPKVTSTMLSSLVGRPFSPPGLRQEPYRRAVPTLEWCIPRSQATLGSAVASNPMRLPPPVQGTRSGHLNPGRA